MKKCQAFIIVATAMLVGAMASILTTYLLRTSLANEAAQLAEEQSERIVRRILSDPMKVLIARKDVNPSITLMRPDEVFAEREMARISVPMGTFADMSSLEGRSVVRQILKGEILLERDLAPSKVLGSTVSIRIKDWSKVKGFPIPGQHVDVFDLEDGDKKIIARSAKVLAVDVIAPRPVEAPLNPGWVVLETTPEKARLIREARGRGTIILEVIPKEETAQEEPPPLPPPPPSPEATP